MARDRKHRLHLLLVLEVCNLINVVCVMAILCITAVCVETMNMEEYESVDLASVASDTDADEPSPTTRKGGRKRGWVPTDVLGNADEPSPTTSKGGRKRGRIPIDVLGSADEPSPTTNKGGRKRGRASDDVAKSISEIATIFGSFCHATNDRLANIAKTINYEQDGRDPRKNLNCELKKLPLDLKTRMRALLSIFKSDTLVDIFFSLKLEEERMTFIRHVLH